MIEKVEKYVTDKVVQFWNETPEQTRTELEKHISLQLMCSIIKHNFSDGIREHTHLNAQNLAFASCMRLFEINLEIDCRHENGIKIWKGNNEAARFCNLFPCRALNETDFQTTLNTIQ